MIWIGGMSCAFSQGTIYMGDGFPGRTRKEQGPSLAAKPLIYLAPEVGLEPTTP